MQPELKTKTSVGMETVDQTVARAKQMIQPTISANELANPPAKLNLTTPPEPTIPDRVNTTTNNVLGSIRSQSETAKRLQEEQAAFQTFTNGQSGFDIQNEQLQRFGVTPERLQELADIELQLADRTTASNLNKVRIESGGQSAIQGPRSLTQEDREEAVRSAGLAARASVLQGNINTGRQLANDAVNIALQDRTFQANAKIMQINQLKEVVDEETRQLLQAEERTYEAELATIKELKENVSQAIVSGASQSEIATMNDPNTPDADKLALAQSIVARNAREEIGLDREAQRADIAQGWAGLDIRKQELELSKQRLNAELNATGNTYGTMDGKPQTAAQALVNSYANRLIESETVFDAVADQFADKFAFGGVLPSLLQSGERQQYEQAKRNFVNAVLRRESGAVIADSEFKNAELQYFPQAGDKPETVIQKEQNRNTVINNFYREANVPRPVFAGDIIESGGKKYQVAEDGVSLIEI